MGQREIGLTGLAILVAFVAGIGAGKAQGRATLSERQAEWQGKIDMATMIAKEAEVQNQQAQARLDSIAAANLVRQDQANKGRGRAEGRFQTAQETQDSLLRRSLSQVDSIVAYQVAVAEITEAYEYAMEVVEIQDEIITAMQESNRILLAQNAALAQNLERMTTLLNERPEMGDDCKILGLIKCPSRTVTGVVGAVAGVVAGLALGISLP